MGLKRNHQRWVIRQFSLLLLAVILFMSGLSASGVPVRAAAVLHVPANYPTIQSALNAAAAGDTVLVAEGEYQEILDFHCKDITLQSETGYAKTTIMNKANSSASVTIGPLGKLIGFTLDSNGNANAQAIHLSGADTLIQGNTIIHFNSAFNTIIYGYIVSPVINGNIFRNNLYDVSHGNQGVIGFGGASSPLITNNIFEDNTGVVLKFGLAAGSSPRVINNIFFSNSIAIQNDKNLPTAGHVYRNNLILNHSFAGLDVTGSDGTYDAVWDHNLVWGNVTNYSGIPDPTGTNGNLFADPLFLSAYQPFMLQHDSPAIDAGNNDSCPALDFRGVARPQGTACDIGVYEGYANMLSWMSDPGQSYDRTVPTWEFQIRFAEPVTGVDKTPPFSDFSLGVEGLTGAAITAVSGSGADYRVTVTTGNGAGRLRLDIVDDDTILDQYSLPLGGAGLGNGDYRQGQWVVIDHIPPTVTSIVRADPNPSQTSPVHFNVTFSEMVGDVDKDDFDLTATGSIHGASVSTVIITSLTTNTFSVTVDPGNGEGTFRLDVPTSATVHDNALNPLYGLPFESGESYDVSFYNLYLPLTSKPKRANLYGTALFNGIPAADKSLSLRYFSAGQWTTINGFTTEVDGYYGFNNVNSLAEGQAYAVCFSNPGYPGYLYAYCTRVLHSYTSGDTVWLGDFDLADIEVTSPTDLAATLSLPYTFAWKPRPATPSDSYEFDLYDPSDGDPYFYAPKLGYVNSYTLVALPPGFVPNIFYFWEIWVYAPDGGYGISNAPSWVQFTNRGVSSPFSLGTPFGTFPSSRGLENLPHK